MEEDDNKTESRFSGEFLLMYYLEKRESLFINFVKVKDGFTRKNRYIAAAVPLK